jgi:hypothetical protein
MNIIAINCIFGQENNMELKTKDLFERTFNYNPLSGYFDGPLDGGPAISRLAIPQKSKWGNILIFLEYGYKPNVENGRISMSIYRPETVRIIILQEKLEVKNIEISELLNNGFISQFPSNTPLGIDTRLGSTEELKIWFERIYELYDILLPIYFYQKENNLLKTTVLEYMQLFNKLSEPLSMPYYKKLGEDFFEWLERIN